MSFGKLSSHTMVFQPFNAPQTSSTPNSDSSALFAQLGAQANFGYSMAPMAPMPVPAYAFQSHGGLMINPMCAPQPAAQQMSSGGADQAHLASGARRKNATRETTATLKAWLYEHRKNPYPTKGEKIMLAIITRMSLNQVSTWFANARRRLKKENKMGKDLDDSDSDDLTKSKKASSANKLSGSTSSDNMNMDDLDDLDDLNEDVSDDDHDHEPTSKAAAKFYAPSPVFKAAGCVEPAKKPKIWSIADVATKPSPPTHKPASPARPLNVTLSSSSSSSSCPSPMKNEQFLAAFSAAIGHHQSQPLSVPSSSSPSSTTSTLSSLSTESATLVNYQQLYYQHLTSQFTNEFLRHSFLQHQQQQQQHQQQMQQHMVGSVLGGGKASSGEIGSEQSVNGASREERECDEEQQVVRASNGKRELDEDESNSSFESNGSNGKKLKVSHESDLSSSSSLSSSLSQSSPRSCKRKLDDSL